MGYRLYLDDLRDPRGEGWVVVRSVEAFERVIEERGIPEAISFDHDLGEDVPDGHDAARWLFTWAIERGVDLRAIQLNIHSANPVGVQRIASQIQSYRKYMALSEEDEL